MKAQVKMLSLTVWITIGLLLTGALLVVLGIFNQQLKWDIFSPQLESILYGIFFSCITLGLFGIAITFVLGIKQIVEAVESLRRKSIEPTFIPVKRRRLAYAGYMMGLFTAFAGLIFALERVDQQIQVRRSQVFKQIAAIQVERFGDRLTRPLVQQPITTLNTVPSALPTLMATLNDLSSFENTVLYVADPQDDTALWSYEVYQTDSKGKPIFRRFLIAKDEEIAIQMALQGNLSALEDRNQETNFTWYYPIMTDRNRPLAILKVVGNPGENFRDLNPGRPTV